MKTIAKHCFAIFKKKQKDWQQILKVAATHQTLKLLGEVLLNGNPLLFDYLKKHRHELMVLEHYNFYDKTVDRGILVREKLNWLNRVLDNPETFFEEKSKSSQLLNNMVPIDFSGHGRKEYYSPGATSGEEGASPTGTKKKGLGLRLKVSSPEKDEANINEQLMDDEDQDAANVCFNSVPINKSEFTFFKENLNNTPSKASQSGAKSKTE